MKKKDNEQRMDVVEERLKWKIGGTLVLYEGEHGPRLSASEIRKCHVWQSVPWEGRSKGCSESLSTGCMYSTWSGKGDRGEVRGPFQAESTRLWWQ